MHTGDTPLSNPAGDETAPDRLAGHYSSPGRKGYWSHPLLHDEHAWIRQQDELLPDGTLILRPRTCHIEDLGILRRPGHPGAPIEAMRVVLPDGN